MSDDDLEPTGATGEPDSALLASAYLDDEVGSDERALVETSPDTLDDVRRFGDVRTVLAATAPSAPLAQREAHLAAALDVWASMSANDQITAATTTATPSRARRPKRSKQRSGDGFGASQWFLSAAAVLVVVAGGAAIVRGIVAETDDDQVASIQESAPADDAAPDQLVQDEATEVSGGDVGADAVLSDELIADEVASDGLFDGEDAADDADSTRLEAADLPEAAVQPAPAAEEDLVEIETLEGLADFGSLVIPSLNAGPEADDDIDYEAPFGTCEDQLSVEENLGPARYQGTDVIVGVDIDGGTVIAYLDETCDVVESVPLPDTERDVAPEPVVDEP